MSTPVTLWSYYTCSYCYYKAARISLSERNRAKRLPQARSHLDPESLLKDDPADVLEKVNITVNLVNHHKYLLSAYRENVKESCLRQEVTPADWSFADKVVCSRLDAFLSRLKKVKVGCGRTPLLS